MQEYIVWRVWEEAIDWFALHDGRYERLSLTASGLYQSQVFPGLWLDPAAMLRGDMAQVLAVVQEGLASREYAEFKKRLASHPRP